MIFVDYLGPATHFGTTRTVVTRATADTLRVSAEQVSVRHLLTEGWEALELWIELSSEEQLYRLGTLLAERITNGLREIGVDLDVWVMYRVVPRSHAFHNGAPRRRGVATFE